MAAEEVAAAREVELVSTEEEGVWVGGGGALQTLAAAEAMRSREEGNCCRSLYFVIL
jgi:hypothetical protein